MAEPGDPLTPDDHDDLIGFTSPTSLVGVERRPEPAPELPPVAVAAEPVLPDADRDLDLFGDLEPPTPAAAPEVAPVYPASLEQGAGDPGPLFSERTPSVPPAPAAVAPVAAEADVEAQQIYADPAASGPPPVAPAAAALPEWRREAAPAPRPPSASFGRARRAEPTEGVLGLYTVYALILFAIPTAGVSALIGLFAVNSLPRPRQPLAFSHFVFQRRTLWIAAFGAVLGVILIAVNLGVFVLFALALWILMRGAVGVLRLAADQPIKNPKTLFL